MVKTISFAHHYKPSLEIGRYKICICSLNVSLTSNLPVTSPVTLVGYRISLSLNVLIVKIRKKKTHFIGLLCNLNEIRYVKHLADAWYVVYIW